MYGYTFRFSALLLIAVSVVFTACSKDDPVTPPDGTLGVKATLANAVTDTIDAPVPVPLVAEVRGRDGRLAAGAIVRFEARASTRIGRIGEPTATVCSRSPSPCPTTTLVAIDTTDVAGRAEVNVRLGRVSGATYVLVGVPEFGVVDSALFTVLAGAAVRVRAGIKDTLINIGSTITVGATVDDRYGNARGETPVLTTGPENVFTLDANTGRVTARDLGTQFVFARAGALADSTQVRILPGGTLVVWNSNEGTIQLMNLGRDRIRTIASGIVADNGAFPRFDPTGQRVTTLLSLFSGAGISDDAVMLTDTTGVLVRYVSPANGFQSILSSRQTADGSLLVVGRLVLTPATYSLYRVSVAGVITKVIDIPALVRTTAAADIAYDGSRIAYLVPVSSKLELRIINVNTGAIAVIESDARSPRWSHAGDRVAYTINAFSSATHSGAIAISNADGSGRRTFGDIQFNPGFAWSPDDNFIIGGNPQTGSYRTTRLLRLRDGYPTLFAYLSRADVLLNYSQFDWQ